MQTLSLNGDWTLYYALETKETENSLDYLRRAGECIPAQVPGNVEIDLERAGKEPDPFFGENIYRFRKYEFYRWQFERDFLAPENGEGEWKLIFEGLNNFAEVYLNDQKIGEIANAFIAHEMDVAGAIRWGEINHLTVRIRSALNEARKMDIPAYVSTHECGEFMMLRMPSSSFGWDIMGRFPSAGMWRGVRLEQRKLTRIVDAYYATMRLSPQGDAVLRLRYRWETDAPILDRIFRRKGHRLRGWTHGYFRAPGPALVAQALRPAKPLHRHADPGKGRRNSGYPGGSHRYPPD